MTANFQPHAMEGVERRLALLRSSAVRVALLIAPAGYGKTTVANALRTEYAYSGTCNCESSGLGEFARNVLAALASENRAQSSFFLELQAHLAVVLDDENACKNVLKAAWAKDPPRALFTFENAESISGNSALTSAFITLLNSAPPNRKIIVCSRTPLPARASRYLPPHRLTKLTTTDFALSDAEAGDLLEQHGVPELYRQRIIDVARGWPVVLLLLARLYREDRLEPALAGLNNAGLSPNNADFEDLFVYLLHEVLAPLDPIVKQVMTFCAVVPDLTTDELCIATGQTQMQLQETLRKTVLVQTNGATFSIHPLVRQVLLQTQDHTDVPLSIARCAEERGDFRRAAMLYRLSGDHDSAARAMASLSMQELQKTQSAYELAQLPLACVREHPRLVFVAEHLRSDMTTDFLREAFEGLTAQDDPEAVVGVAEAYSDRLDDLSQVLGVVDSPLVRRASETSAAARLLLAGWTESRRAYFQPDSALEGPMREAYRLFEEADLPLNSARMAHHLDNVLRLRGDRQGSLHWQAICVEKSRRCGPLLHAECLVLAIFCAWYWGDDTATKAYRDELEAAVSATGHPDYAQALRALQADSVESLVPLGEISLTERALIMAASKADERSREALFEYGTAMIRNAGLKPAPSFILAQAAANPALRKPLCQELLSALDPDGLPELRAAIEAFAQGRPSYLDTFTARFQQKTTASTSAIARSLRLEVLHERIVIDGAPIRLTAREAAVLTFLSRRRIATPREEIQDAIWPDLDETGARDALYSLLHRLRKRTMRSDIVQGAGNAYRLAEGVKVDLWDLEFIAQQLQRGAAVDASSSPEHMYALVQTREYPNLRQYEWFAPIEFRVHESARVLAQYLIGDAKKRGDDAAVVRYVADLIGEDPCDEWAHETLIRFHLEKQNHIEAVRAYRSYCELLEKQLGASPSNEMQQLARSLLIER